MLDVAFQVFEAFAKNQRWKTEQKLEKEIQNIVANCRRHSNNAHINPWQMQCLQ